MSEEKTHAVTCLPLAEDKRITTFSNQWLLRAPDDAIKVHPYSACNLEYLICGEEAFKRIARDIEGARSTIDIICWGFDPAMELERSAEAWPRGATWAGLLGDATRRNPSVKVRLLSWYGFIGGRIQNNLPGYSDRLFTFGSLTDPGSIYTAQSHEQARKVGRDAYNAHWFKLAMAGKLPNLSIRTRNGDDEYVEPTLRKDDRENNPPADPDAHKRGWTENLLLEHFATHHQKTILIDYELDEGAHAVGYVMGLNSVTDYWDTRAHKFNDPYRGASEEGHAEEGYTGLRPYQDYATRITGAALVAVSKNFSDAWNRAKGNGDNLLRNEDLANPPKGLEKNVGSERHQLQIVRTQPEEYGGEQTIKRLYWQATEFAQNYIYIENQYFQYAPWAEHLKKKRQEYVSKYCGHGGKGNAPELNLFVVTPTPEQKGMVPRTHDTTKSLGLGDSFPNQDAAIESGRIGGEVAQSAKAVGTHANIAKELREMGLRTLAVSLWTFNDSADAIPKEDKRLLDEWKDMPGQSQRYQALRDRIYAKCYREIYIHSKLMLIDDAMFTLGSANLNQRSLAADSEINVTSDHPKLSARFRADVFKQHAKEVDKSNPSTSTSAEMKLAHQAWERTGNQNLQAKDEGRPLSCFIVKLHDKRTSSTRVG